MIQSRKSSFLWSASRGVTYLVGIMVMMVVKRRRRMIRRRSKREITYSWLAATSSSFPFFSNQSDGGWQKDESKKFSNQSQTYFKCDE